MIYNSWLMDWLENYVKPSVKIRTYERYYGICVSHIIPAIGGYKLSDITVIQMQKFISNLLNKGNLKTGKGLSANFVDGYLLKKCLPKQFAHRPQFFEV